MSYYENNGPWPTQTQNTWEHQASTPIRPGASRPSALPTPANSSPWAYTPQNNNNAVDSDSSTAGASGPQPQDEFAFSQQFEEVDRAHENLSKSGKAYGMPGARREYAGSPAPGIVKHHSRMNTISGPAPRPHSMNAFDEIRNHGGPGLQSFYANQRHTSSRGSNEAEQVMQSKRRMAAQRERELRNHHMEQQFQRTVTTDASYSAKSLSEEQTRQLIARQRSALYREGQFVDKLTYVDETGALRQGMTGASGPSSLRGQSPMAFELGRAHPPTDGMPTVGATATSVSAMEASQQVSPVGAIGDASSRANSTASPQLNAGAAAKAAFEGIATQVNRTSASSPTDSLKPDSTPAAKVGQHPAVAPIGTRPMGVSMGAASAVSSSSAKRSTTPLASPGGWAPRGNNLWGQSSGLSSQASVWG